MKSDEGSQIIKAWAENLDDVNNIVKKDMIQCFNLLLSPFAPHVAEEIHQKLGNNNSVVFENFPLTQVHNRSIMILSI